ncbi:hypothetical protein HOS79_gp027 [Lactobacillus phage Nyseid]|uniref:Uncharacterized protein n=1 Tax=Lactobacillus phage Nyseid TaxID=2079432 RepID=A0A2K9VC53_9CAUD|nr:hypothetical protein HOS79_gp027 [Lactobacillus phage Nyseid]AUV59787.1 hypothetical protein [Lactobacillus phage Nyseid]
MYLSIKGQVTNMLVKANEGLYLDADSIKYMSKSDFGSWRIVFNDGSHTVVGADNAKETLMNLADQTEYTPVKDQKTLKNWRNTNKKYYIKIKGLDKETGYLNYDMQEDRYFTDDTNDSFSWAKVSFSVDEIDGMINNPGFFLTENNFDPIPVGDNNEH